MTTTETAAITYLGVHDAAKILDVDHPGWHDKVNLATLNMWSCSACIIGQTLGLEGYAAFEWEGELIRLETSHGVRFDGSVFAGETNRGQWIEEIRARRAAR